MPKATLWDYILSPIHPIGRFKYRLFLSIGYATDDWEIFKVDLLHPAASDEAVAGEATQYGQKYELRGTLKSPTGISVEIISVWIVRNDENVPRFVTAYPGGEG